MQQYFFSGAALHVQEEHSHVIAILCCGCFRLYEQLLNMDICVGPLDSQEHKFRYRQKNVCNETGFLRRRIKNQNRRPKKICEALNFAYVTQFFVLQTIRENHIQILQSLAY